MKTEQSHKKYHDPCMEWRRQDQRRGSSRTGWTKKEIREKGRERREKEGKEEKGKKDEEGAGQTTMKRRKPIRLSRPRRTKTNGKEEAKEEKAKE